MASTNEVVFRVYKVPKQLRVQITEFCKTKDLRQQDLITKAIDEKLGGLVTDLLTLNINTPKAVGPVRYPMMEGGLMSLRTASAKVGIPASALLIACLAQATSDEKPKKVSSSRPSSKKVKSRQQISERQGKPRKGTRRSRKAGSK